jgi:two-component system OmpR family sensor kinase
MSLRTRLFAGILLIAVMLGVTAVVVARNTESHLVAQVDARLAAVDEPLRGNEGYSPHDQGGFDDGAPEQLSSFWVGYVDADGDVYVVSEPNADTTDPPAPTIDPADVQRSLSDGLAFTTSSTSSDVRYRVLATRGRIGNAEVTSLVALPLSDVDDAVSRLIVVEVVATGAALTVLAFVAWWVLHLGVRPIKRMTATATAIASGDLSHRVPDADPHTEAGQLGLALNQMLGRIEGAFDERARSEDRLRQFIADASHELRTPITTIRGYAELYRTGGLSDADDMTDAMRRAEQEAVRMSVLVDDMLQLARLDRGRPLERAPVDLAALAHDAARDAGAVDPARTITCDAEGVVTVIGDEDRLRQVIANLLANALVHTPEGTPVDVHAGVDGGRAVLDVVDHGPGMPPDVAARVFERFYRADPSRSRHRGGSGLGLAIVEATVAAHGGTVRLRSAPGAGTAVRIELPLHAIRPLASVL